MARRPPLRGRRVTSIYEADQMAYPRRPPTSWLASATFAALGLLTTPATAAAAPEPGSQLIGCEQADQRVTVQVSSHLDPSCTYHGGFDIVSSDVVFDCQGASIVDNAGVGRGIAINAPTTVALSDVTVRNCHIEGYLNNVRITREGFKQLAVGREYENAFDDIVVEDSTIADSQGVGVFVDGFVTGVTLRRLDVHGAGSTGIYLEGSSKGNEVVDNDIHDNGSRENGPGGQLIELAGVTFRWWGTGREGLAVDGSRYNRVAGNHLWGNSAGGIFLYKNCGEYVNQKPDSWWQRNYGADGNVIEDNTFDGGLSGIWVGSRMGENTLPMDCSDPAYRENALERIVLDHASGNTLRANVFNGVTYGIRVEDDDTTVEGNRFTGGDPAQQAIIVGTRTRTSDLSQPVRGAAIHGNQSEIAGNSSPYRWIHGHEGTSFDSNSALGAPSDLCEGQQPPVSPFIFVLAFAVQDPDGPPAERPALLDQRLPPLAACPASTPTTTPLPAAPSTSAAATTSTRSAGSRRPAPSASAAVATPRFTG